MTSASCPSAAEEASELIGLFFGCFWEVVCPDALRTVIVVVAGTDVAVVLPTVPNVVSGPGLGAGTTADARVARWKEGGPSGLIRFDFDSLLGLAGDDEEASRPDLF